MFGKCESVAVTISNPKFQSPIFHCLRRPHYFYMVFYPILESLYLAHLELEGASELSFFAALITTRLQGGLLTTGF